MNGKTMRPTSFLCLILCLISVVIATPAKAAIEKLHYEVYAGGIHALSVDLEIDREPKTYQLALKAKPYGVIGNLLPWAGTYKATGKIVKNTYLPDRFDKTSQWQEDSDHDSFVYKNGQLISQTETNEKKKPVVTKNIPVDPQMTKDAVDILTGTLRLLQAIDADNNCNHATTIYDGKRRYDLKFHDKGGETLQASKYNSYNGATKICEIEMIPISGFPKKQKGYYKIQEEARARGALPTVWLGRVESGYAPVKMMVKSEMGAVLIHLQKPGALNIKGKTEKPPVSTQNNL